MNICEITLKKDQTPEGQKRPDVLNRKIEVSELKSTVRLKMSVAGLKALKEVGGITQFLTERDEKKLSPKLLKLKNKLIAAGKIEVKQEEPEPTEEAAAAAPAAEAQAETAEGAEAPAEAAPEAAKPEEKAAEEAAPAEEAKAEEKPAEEAPVEEKPAEPASEEAAAPEAPKDAPKDDA